MDLRHSVIRSAFHKFAERCGMPISLMDGSTEEIRDSVKSKIPVKTLYAAGQRMLASSMGAKARLEENYLFDTRCFQAGNIASGEYLFFQNAVGQPATNNGFPAGVTIMTDLETNMDVAGQIAQGKNFVFNQIGVSFNADILTGDCATLMEAGALRFEKQGGQYTLRHGPIRFWPGGMGVNGYSTATGVTGAANGLADLRVARKLAIPRVIREKESFNYKYVVPRTVRNTNGSTTIAVVGGSLMTVWLWGGQQDTIPV